jgi:hypothetical protein
MMKVQTGGQSTFGFGVQKSNKNEAGFFGR